MALVGNVKFTQPIITVDTNDLESTAIVTAGSEIWGFLRPYNSTYIKRYVFEKVVEAFALQGYRLISTTGGIYTFQIENTNAPENAGETAPFRSVKMEKTSSGWNEVG